MALRRQLDRRPQAPLVAIRQRQRPAFRLDDAGDDRQAQAEADGVARPRRIEPDERLPGAADKVRLEVTLHGVTRTAEVPVHIERGKTSISASGQLTLKQTDFGITPMSVMAGAMVVQDQMELKFKIVAGTAR